MTTTTATKKRMKVEKTITDLETLYNSEEFKAIFSGFENNIPMEKKALEQWTEFKKAYVVWNERYSCFDIYKHYIADGINFLGQVKLGSTLHDGPFSEWFDLGKEIVIVRRFWKKCEENREKIRALGMKVTDLW